MHLCVFYNLGLCFIIYDSFMTHIIYDLRRNEKYVNVTIRLQPEHRNIACMGN